MDANKIQRLSADARAARTNSLANGGRQAGGGGLGMMMAMMMMMIID